MGGHNLAGGLAATAGCSAPVTALAMLLLLHGPWVQSGGCLREALAAPNNLLVSDRRITAHRPRPQVLDWMKNPVPASEYRLPCPTPADMWFATGKFCAAPSGGCVQAREGTALHTLAPGACQLLTAARGYISRFMRHTLPLPFNLQGTWNPGRCACDCLVSGQVEVQVKLKHCLCLLSESRTVHLASLPAQT